MKFILLSLSLLLSCIVLAADTNLTWVAPIEREDNTAFAENEIKEFRVYYGTAPGDYQNTVSVVRADVNVVTPLHLSLVLPTGFIYYFVVTTVDVDGRESLYSDEVFIPLDHEKPKKPTNVLVIKIVTKVTVTN